MIKKTYETEQQKMVDSLETMYLKYKETLTDLQSVTLNLNEHQNNK